MKRRLISRLQTVRGLVIASVLFAAACAGVSTNTAPPAPGVGYPVRMETRRVPLGLGGAQLAPGVTYAGGISIHGAYLHGLSDLKLAADAQDEDNRGEHVWAVSDFGDLVQFRLHHDRSGRLISAGSASFRRLTDLDGAPLGSKPQSDAEGLAILDDGRILISFERDHRIWSYGPNASQRPTPLRHPDTPVPANEGMEGLSAAPEGWLVLGEAGGAWVCNDAACRALPKAPTSFDDGYRFTSADRDPAGGWFVTQRAYTPPLNMRVRVRRMAPDGALGPVLIALRPPASVDNFEGIAVRPTPTGARLYILSDDNANPLEKTLLLAFDVR